MKLMLIGIYFSVMAVSWAINGHLAKVDNSMKVAIMTLVSILCMLVGLFL